MKKTSKKFLSLFMALIMIFGAAPLGLFALKTQAADETYQNGDIIELGSYPQTRVTDSTLLSALNSKSKTWISYGYYSGIGSYSDGRMTAKDYMKYADVTHNGNKYRAVTFSSYRPDYTGYTSPVNTDQDNNGYTTNNVYWFKYEPLKWRVLDSSSGLVICETIIDSQAYNNYLLGINGEYYGNSSKTYYANNYAKSSIREWLNDDFYNTAFTSSQKSQIKTTTLDNSAYSDSYSKYDSASTNDKVFLLSYDEARNTNYFKNYTARQAIGSDYAKCQGLYVHSENKCSYWRLRSAGGSSKTTYDISIDGRFSALYGTSSTILGIRPVLKLNLQSGNPESEIVGTCGVNLTWSLNRSTGVLTILGTGAMTDWSNSSDVPWDSYRLLIKSVIIGNSVKSISFSAFCNCDSLTSVTIPDSVTSIGDLAFSSCDSLTSVTIGNFVTSIGDTAFCYCNSLTSLTIGNSVTSIGNSAFYYCNSLTDVYYNGTESDWNKITIGSYNDPLKNAKKHYNTDIYEPTYSAEQIDFINNHTKFINSGEMDTIIDTYAIYNNTWYNENGKKLWACRIWDTLGDVGEIATFNFGDLQINADYYELFIADLILELNNYEKLESGNFEDTAIGEAAIKKQNKLYSTLLKLLKDSEEWDKDVTDNMEFEIDEFFKLGSDKKLSASAKSKLSAILGDTFTTKNMSNIQSVFSGIDVAKDLCERLSTAGDLVGIFATAYNSYITTCAVKDMNDEFFKICHAAADQMRADGRAKYANWFESALEKFENAYGSDAFFNELYLKGCLQGIGTSVEIIAGEMLKNMLYEWVGVNVFGLSGGGPVALVTFAYKTTYGLLDLVTGLGNKSENYYYLTYVCPFEHALGKVCKDYAVNLKKSQSYDDAVIFDYAFNILKRTNTFLWKHYYDYCSYNYYTNGLSITGFWKRKEYQQDMSYCSLYESFWKNVSCHRSNEILINQYKTTGYFCPVDIYVYDSSNKLCLSIINDVITIYDQNVFASCSRGEKTVVTPTNKDYRIKVVATDKGSMDYMVNEISDGVSTRAVTYSEISLTKNQIFTGEIPKELNVDNKEYNLVTNNEEIECDGDYDGEIIDENVIKGTCGDNLTWTLNPSTGELVISGTGDMTNWSSSSDVPWYSYLSNIKTVTIGNSVTSIGDYAFYKCDSLTSVIIPDSVTSIGYRAFRSCTSLESVTIGNSVTSIGSWSFSNCDSLTSITIPDSVTSIGENAFRSCDSLTSVTIPDSVTSIESQAFYATAYYNNESNWENDVLYIGKHLIEAKESITGSYAIKDGILTIADYAFYDCDSLTRVTISDSVKSIGDYAFCYCESLTSVTIGDSVTSIGDYAFYDCTSLTSVTIPDSVTSIGKNAFFYCTSLTSVTIGNSVTSIGEYAFYNCESLTSVTIGNSVTSIGDYAFSYCESLTSVTIGNSVTSIGEGAFEYCYSLTSVTIGNSVTSIGDYAFYECTDLTNVYYRGSSEQWQKISIGPFNESLTNATIHYIEISDVIVKSDLAKTEYIYKQDELDISGIELEIIYSDGTSEIITDTSKMTVSGFSNEKRGEQTVTVEYEGLKTEFQVTVKYTWWQWILVILLFGWIWY